MYIQTNNNLIHLTLPAQHWLNPSVTIDLTDADIGRPLPDGVVYEKISTNNIIQYKEYIIEQDSNKLAKILRPIWLEHINNCYSSVISNLVKDYPSYERESWHRQEKEAKDWSLNNDVETPYCTNLANARGIPREYLLSRILINVRNYEVAHAYYTGIRQSKETALKSLDENQMSCQDIFLISDSY